MPRNSVKSNNGHVHNYDHSWKCECGYVLPENLRQDRTRGKTEQFEEAIRGMIKKR